MGGSADREQFMPEMVRSWDALLENLDMKFVFGEKGYQFVLSHAIRASNHAFVTGVTFVTALSPLTNGAAVDIFPGNPSQLNVIAVLVNYPQTRKSQMTKLVKTVVDELDKYIAGLINQAVQKHVADQQERDTEGAGLAVPRPDVVSASISSFTPEIFFERCSGDFSQFANSKDVGMHSLRGTCHYGRFANVDEAYAALSVFGLVQDEGRRSSSSSQANLAVNQHAGALNRLVQFGESSRSTRTSGSFGEGSVPPTTIAMNGNMHPEIAIPMERGTVGGHTGATKERIIFYTAPAVPPHEGLPSDYVLPAGMAPWYWAEMDDDLGELCGLGHMLRDPELAASGGLQRVSPDAIDESGLFQPDCEGYVFNLPDGVVSQLRYNMASGRPVAEFRIGFRAFPLPAEHDVGAACRRVFKVFAVPHVRLQPTEGAQQLMKAVETTCNIKAGVAAQTGDYMAAARWGAGPWKVGVLAGLLLAFDVFVGQDATYQPDDDNIIQFDRCIVARAKALHRALEAARSMWHAATEPAEAPVIAAAPSAELQAGLIDSAITPRGMAAFPATQPPDAPAAKRRRGAPSQQEPRDEDNQEGDPFVPKLVADGVPMTVGYGLDGVTAQRSWTESALFKTDRDLMQRTLLRGKPMVYAYEVCDSLRRPVTGPGGKVTRKGFPRAVWEEVMLAGFGKYPVGKMLDAGGTKSRVVFSKPPSHEDGRESLVSYHNMLVDLCQVGARQFRQLLDKYAEQNPDSTDGLYSAADSADARAPAPGAGAASDSASASAR